MYTTLHPVVLAAKSQCVVKIVVHLSSLVRYKTLLILDVARNTLYNCILTHFILQERQQCCFVFGLLCSVQCQKVVVNGRVCVSKGCDNVRQITNGLILAKSCVIGSICCGSFNFPFRQPISDQTYLQAFVSHLRVIISKQGWYKLARVEV
jgi:hypothetical protein